MYTIGQKLDIQLKRCQEGREKGENWEVKEENLSKISFSCGKRSRWLAHVQFWDQTCGISEKYFLESAQLDADVKACQ